jgi:hypothetical protein
VTEAHRPRHDALPLHARQCAILDLVLDMIVPPGPDGRLPGASQVGVPAHLMAWAPQLMPVLAAELDRLTDESRRRHGCDFPVLQAAQRQALVDAIRGVEPSFMRPLALETVTCYYQDDRVLAALEEPLRAPYPQGYQVLQGDLGLLAPVRRRGKMYRDAP